MIELWQHTRFAFRTLWRSPAFTVPALLALALTIGANGILFTVVDAALINPLPFPNAEDLLLVGERTAARPDVSALSYPEFIDWRDQTREVFKYFATSRRDSVNLSSTIGARQLSARAVSGEFFSTLGVRVAAGRSFALDDDREGSPRTAIISDGLFRSAFGGDQNVVGQSVQLSEESYTIIGVLRPDFRFFGTTDVYLPLGSFAHHFQSRGEHPNLFGITRLRAGKTIADARVALEAVSRRLEAEYPATNSEVRASVSRLIDVQTGTYRTALLLLWGAVACLLLLGVADVANLLLARVAARSGEFSIRVALGAGRAHLARQLLTESVILGLAGGALGLLLAYWGVGAAKAIVPGALLQSRDWALNYRVVAFSFTLSFVVGLLIGTLPSCLSFGGDLSNAIRGHGVTSSRRVLRLRDCLIVSEVALALLLLVAAGLFLRSLLRLHAVEPGFDGHHVLTMKLSLPSTRYARGEQVLRFTDALRHRISTLPGVEGVAVSSGAPFLGASETSVAVVGRPLPPRGHEPYAVVDAASPELFGVLRIPLLRGRLFDESDSFRPVVVIDEDFAKRMFSGEDPVGQRLYGPGGVANPGQEIIGVVGHVLDRALDGSSPVGMQVYLPYGAAATRQPRLAVQLLVRCRLAPHALEAAIRSELTTLDPQVPAVSIQTMDEIIERTTGDRRFSTLLLALFACAALSLATVGIYGVTAYGVSQRARELGTRMALGATPSSIVRLIVSKSLQLGVAGIGLGLLLALAASRFVAARLYGISAADPITYAVLLPLLVITVLAASWVPARRAARIDPSIAMKAE